MCWTPELIEFPCEWKDDGQDNFEELGIKPTLHKGTVLLDVKSITRMNEANLTNDTTVEVSGTLWIIKIPLVEMKKIINKCGVNVKSYKEVVNEL